MEVRLQIETISLDTLNEHEWIGDVFIDFNYDHFNELVEDIGKKGLQLPIRIIANTRKGIQCTINQINHKLSSFPFNYFIITSNCRICGSVILCLFSLYHVLKSVIVFWYSCTIHSSYHDFLSSINLLKCSFLQTIDPYRS